MSDRNKVVSSLPPGVRGHLHGYITLKIPEVYFNEESMVATTFVRVKWWGEIGRGVDLYPAVVQSNGKLISQPLNTFSCYAIRAGIKPFTTYLKDMDYLTLQLVDHENSKMFSRCIIYNVVDVVSHHAIFGEYPIINNDNCVIGMAKVSLNLELFDQTAEDFTNIKKPTKSLQQHNVSHNRLQEKMEENISECGDLINIALAKGRKLREQILKSLIDSESYLDSTNDDYSLDTSRPPTELLLEASLNLHADKKSVIEESNNLVDLILGDKTEEILSLSNSSSPVKSINNSQATNDDNSLQSDCSSHIVSIVEDLFFDTSNEEAANKVSNSTNKVPNMIPSPDNRRPSEIFTTAKNESTENVTTSVTSPAQNQLESPSSSEANDFQVELIFNVTNGRNLSTSNRIFLASRLLTPDHEIKSRPMKNTLRGIFFNFTSRIVTKLDDNFLSKLRNNYVIIEVWSKDSMDKLVGISKVPLSKLYSEIVTQTNNTGSSTLSRRIVGFNGWINIVDLFTNEIRGQLNVLLSVEPLVKVHQNIDGKINKSVQTSPVRLRNHCLSPVDIFPRDGAIDRFLIDSIPSLNVNSTNEIVGEKVHEDKAMIPVEVFVERGTNVEPPQGPSSKWCDKKSIYLSFNADKPIYSCLVPGSPNPVFNWKENIKFSSDRFRQNLILKLWTKSGLTGKPDKCIDEVEGFVCVNLSGLSSGLDQLIGWYNIMDFTGRCKGQMKVSITPLHPISSLNINEECVKSVPSGSRYLTSGTYGSFPSHSLHFTEQSVKFYNEDHRNDVTVTDQDDDDDDDDGNQLGEHNFINACDALTPPAEDPTQSFLIRHVQQNLKDLQEMHHNLVKWFDDQSNVADRSTNICDKAEPTPGESIKESNMTTAKAERFNEQTNTIDRQSTNDSFKSESSQEICDDQSKITTDGRRSSDDFHETEIVPKMLNDVSSHDISQDCKKFKNLEGVAFDDENSNCVKSARPPYLSMNNCRNVKNTLNIFSNRDEVLRKGEELMKCFVSHNNSACLTPESSNGTYDIVSEELTVDHSSTSESKISQNVVNIIGS